MDENADIDAAADGNLPCVWYFCILRAAVSEKDIDKILEIALEYLRDQLYEAKTFRLKQSVPIEFPYNSPEISAMVGGKLKTSPS